MTLTRLRVQGSGRNMYSVTVVRSATGAIVSVRCDCKGWCIRRNRLGEGDCKHAKAARAQAERA